MNKRDATALSPPQKGDESCRDLVTITHGKDANGNAFVGFGVWIHGQRHYQRWLLGHGAFTPANWEHFCTVVDSLVFDAVQAVAPVQGTLLT